ncbi:Helix-turn-helix [Achromobacter aegrifaciens]|uniref:Helix-turn-helix n=2 Tax=Achromobacter aegrifaciens TaxID=1287736 RepID=A0AAD2QD95_ACHAE|nr:Helix-turn-helix [Achromobacter aegrifaciens]
MSQAQLAKIVGAGQSTIASIENGRNKGSSLFLDLARALNVNVEWLMDGAGPKRGTKGAPGAAPLKVEAAWPFEKVTLEQFASLPRAAKADIEDYIEMKVAKALGVPASRAGKTAA